MIAGGTLQQPPDMGINVGLDIEHPCAMSRGRYILGLGRPSLLKSTSNGADETRRRGQGTSGSREGRDDGGKCIRLVCTCQRSTVNRITRRRTRSRDCNRDSSCRVVHVKILTCPATVFFFAKRGKFILQTHGEN